MEGDMRWDGYEAVKTSEEETVSFFDNGYDEIKSNREKQKSSKFLWGALCFLLAAVAGAVVYSSFRGDLKLSFSSMYLSSDSSDRDSKPISVKLGDHPSVKAFYAKHARDLTSFLPDKLELTAANQADLTSAVSGIDLSTGYVVFPLQNNDENGKKTNHEFLVIMGMGGEVVNVLPRLGPHSTKSIKCLDSSTIGFLLSNGDTFKWNWKIDELEHLTTESVQFAGSHFQYLPLDKSYLFVKDSHDVVEVDADTGKEKWTWSLPLTNLKQPEINHVFQSSESAVFLSVKNANSVYKVDRDSNEVEWIFGGEQNQFEGVDVDGHVIGKGSTFFYNQHAVEELRPGVLLMFDNGFDGVQQLYSSKIRVFKLDEENKRFEEIWQYDTKMETPLDGEVHYLPTGNFLVSTSYVSSPRYESSVYQVTDLGEKVWELGIVGNSRSNNLQTGRSTYGWFVSTVDMFLAAPHIYDMSRHKDTLSFNIIDSVRSVQRPIGRFDLFHGSDMVLSQSINLGDMWKPSRVEIKNLETICSMLPNRAVSANVTTPDGTYHYDELNRYIYDIEFEFCHEQTRAPVIYIPSDDSPYPQSFQVHVSLMVHGYTKEKFESELENTLLEVFFMLTNNTHIFFEGMEMICHPEEILDPVTYPECVGMENVIKARYYFGFARFNAAADFQNHLASGEFLTKAVEFVMKDEKREVPDGFELSEYEVVNVDRKDIRGSWSPTPFFTHVPTITPTHTPNSIPTHRPTPRPSWSFRPTVKRPGPRTDMPTFPPKPTVYSAEPTLIPTHWPTLHPTFRPSPIPTPMPSKRPTPHPTVVPTPAPSRPPFTRLPSSVSPTTNPIPWPTQDPTAFTSKNPSPQPLHTSRPTRIPSPFPTPMPTKKPTFYPTEHTKNPTVLETHKPTRVPTRPTDTPTHHPHMHPSKAPSGYPSVNPTHIPTPQPTRLPSSVPSPFPTFQPTKKPTRKPSKFPTPQPSHEPTFRDTWHPTKPTFNPTFNPSKMHRKKLMRGHPTLKPTRRSFHPSPVPTPGPTNRPTPEPSPAPIPCPTHIPTPRPSVVPTQSPTKWVQTKSHPRTNSEGFRRDASLVMRLSSYADSLDGDCSTAESTTCNLRAAIQSAAAIDGKVVIMVGIQNPHALTEGQIYIPSTSHIMLVADQGIAEIDGTDNSDRCFYIEDGAEVEIAHLTFKNFNHEEDGGVIYNMGSCTTYRAQFETNTAGKRGGAVYNGGSLSLRHYLLTSNTAYDDGNDIYNEGSFFAEPFPFTGMLGGDSELRYTRHSMESLVQSEDNQVQRQEEEDSKLYDVVVHVNDYSDSSTGECSQFSSTCNIRAALKLAMSTGKATMILLPTSESHTVLEGEIELGSSANVKVTSLTGLAIIDGSANKGRFINVEEGSYLELVHLVITGFTVEKGINGGAIYNKGEVVTYRTEFSNNNAGSVAGALYNSETAILSMWYSSFQNNAVDEDMEARDVYNAGSFYVMPCAPQNGESIVMKGVHLVCYDIKDPAETDGATLPLESTSVDAHQQNRNLRL